MKYRLIATVYASAHIEVEAPSLGEAIKAASSRPVRTATLDDWEHDRSTEWLILAKEIELHRITGFPAP